MDSGDQPLLTFKGVSFINLTYNAKRPLHVEDPLKLEIEPSLFYPDANKDEFQLFMQVSLNSGEHFIINFLAVGLFSLGDSVDESVRKDLVNANAAAIMFPYLRSFITTFTANLGSMIVPIVLPPQFFSGEIKEVTVTGEGTLNPVSFH